jgi:hypothetical protein
MITGTSLCAVASVCTLCLLLWWGNAGNRGSVATEGTGLNVECGGDGWLSGALVNTGFQINIAFPLPLPEHFLTYPPVADPKCVATCQETAAATSTLTSAAGVPWVNVSCHQCNNGKWEPRVSQQGSGSLPSCLMFSGLCVRVSFRVQAYHQCSTASMRVPTP